jgi:hypothetical protein
VVHTLRHKSIGVTGLDGTMFECGLSGCTYYPKDAADACAEIQVAVSFNGLSSHELAKACPAIAAVSDPDDLRRRCGIELPGGGLLRVRDVCPEQCASTFIGTPPDACSVPGGYSTSCGVAVLAQAWEQCPEACQECDYTKRGCVAGAFEDVHAFIGQIKIISNAGHLVGVALYAAYFKTTKYRHLIMGVSVVVAIIRLTDWALVALIEAPPTSDYTVMGIPAPYFAVFGEATQDVIDRILHMPLLVLAAQICPDNIEGTLFAFIMGMSNMGGSYAGEFGSWLTGYLGVTNADFSGLPIAMFLRAAHTVLPILLLWMIPDQNPTEVVSEINGTLGGGEEDEKVSDKTLARDDTIEEPLWDFSGWQMLILLIPPFGVFQIAQPVKNALNLSQAYLAIPVVCLITVPAYQHFIKEKKATSSALSEGLAASATADDQIMLGGAEVAANVEGSEPSNPPPEAITAL